MRVLIPRRDMPKNTPLGEELPFHRISVGDMVILSDNEVERVTLEDTDKLEGAKAAVLNNACRRCREQANVLFNHCDSRRRFRRRVETVKMEDDYE